MSDATDFGHLNSEDWEGLQDVASRFEKACRDDEAADLTSFLPLPGSPLRPLCLHELIKTELEVRWRRGRIIGLEYYAEKFPELGGMAKVPASLVYEEYRVRQMYGDKPQLLTYETRFPAQFADLQRLVEKNPVQAPPEPPQTGHTPTLGPGNPATKTDRHHLPIGGGYYLSKRLGTGGFGEVWRGEAVGGGFEAAIKIIFRPLDHAEAQQELNALELIKRLRHPFLLQTQGYYSFQDRLYIVMELADSSLRERLKECRKGGLTGIPTGELVRYTLEAAEALDYLHSERVQHRDIKPENILLLRRHAKVADFGLAKMQEASRMVTATGSGTPLYMAPEIWRGKRSQHSDQYSLALTYAEMRLGHRVFASSDMMQVMVDHLERQPDLNPLPGGEQDVLLRALAKDPDQRYPSCLEFAQALEAATLAEPRRSDVAMQTLTPGGPTGPSAATPVGSLTRATPTTSPHTLPAPTRVPTPLVPVPTPRSNGETTTAAVEAPLQWKRPTQVARPEQRGLLLAVAGGVAVLLLTVAAVVFWHRFTPPTDQKGPSTSDGTGGDEVALPAGAKPAEGSKLVADRTGRKWPDSIVVTRGDQSVVFRLIPQKHEGDPPSFYIMENKVWNDLFRAATLDRRFQEALDKARKGGQGWMIQEKWRLEGGGRLPVTNVTVAEANLFARWLGGKLPTSKQWKKASGYYEPDRGEGPFRGPWNREDRNAIAVNRGRDGPLPVGTATQDISPFEVRDMAGNGLEWTRNVLLTQDEVPLIEPARDNQVVLRGRSIIEPAVPLLYADLNDPPRLSASYEEAAEDIGFRVVIEPEETGRK